MNVNVSKLLLVFSILFVLIVTSCASAPKRGQSGYTQHDTYTTYGDTYRGR